MSTAEIPVSARLGPAVAGLAMTPDEFDAAGNYDDNYAYELIHGVLVVTPLAGEVERSPNELLGYLLNRYRYEHPQGTALVETLFEQYLKTAGNRRRADRAIWTALPDRRPDPRVELPQIAIEFVSAGKSAWRRDYCEKRDEYLAAGVVEYWVFDRFLRVATVFQRSAGQVTEHVVREQELLRNDLLPGFELRLAEIFAAADRWCDPE